jgi:hypothetical protein
MTGATISAPRWLTWAGIFFVLWSLIGIASFISQWTMSAADIAALPIAERSLWGSMPGWVWAAYAIAVIAALIGSVGLILRKVWAPLAYGISLVAMLAQFSFPFFFAKTAQIDISMIAFPMFIIAMGVVQWLLARHWQRKGWLV